MQGISYDPTGRRADFNYSTFGGDKSGLDYIDRSIKYYGREASYRRRWHRRSEYYNC
jgi:hypothetical protein